MRTTVRFVRRNSFYRGANLRDVPALLTCEQLDFVYTYLNLGIGYGCSEKLRS